MHYKNLLTILTLLCASLPLSARTEYLGVSYKLRTMQGHDAANYYLQPALPNKYNGGEAYFTHRFDNDVGIYIGYEQSRFETKYSLFLPGQQFVGPPPNVDSQSYTRTSIRAIQLDMVGFLEILKLFDAVGQFGLAIMSADMDATLAYSGNTINLDPAYRYKIIPRLSLGLMYFIFKSNFGIRVMGDWEGTNLYRMKITDDDGLRYTIRPFKQSWCLSGGVVVRF